MMNVEFNPNDISSPKRSKFGDRRAIADWYGYYAGYSVEFVRDILSVLQPSQNGLVVDPWNGAGTTTTTASLLGYQSFGSDINPVMSILSRARSAKVIERESILATIPSDWTKLRQGPKIQLPWFSAEACSTIGAIRGLISEEHISAPEHLTDHECLLLTAMFGTLNKYLRHLKGTNRAWCKDTYGEPLNPEADSLYASFRSSLETLLDGIDCDGFKSVESPVSPTITTATSWDLPLQDGSADLIVTSPPYLTRLDYVRAMLLEVTLLGLSPEQMNSLRRQMIGSVMGGDFLDIDVRWGREAKSVIEHAMSAAIERERGDGRYYSGTFRRYFCDLFRSMEEMDRVLAPCGAAVLVVQGSRHRGRIIDLPLIVHQMGQSIGWQPLRAVAWPTRDLGKINPRSNKYGAQTIHETAVLFRKS